MPRIPISQLPPSSRLWVFPSSRPLDEDDLRRLLEETDEFLDGWTAHGRPLTSGREVVEDRFLVIAVDEGKATASGCSIDSLVGRLRVLQKELGLSLLDHSGVRYRDAAGEIQRADRPEFRRLAKRGKVNMVTRVFDATLRTLGELRSGMLERDARESWHAGLIERPSHGVPKRPASGTAAPE